MKKVNLAPHQREAVKKLHNGCILWGGVGVGKSRVALAYYVENESPKDVYVITTARKRDSMDWNGEAAEFVIGTSPEASLHGVLHVDSWNNIKKYTGVYGAFFIFDEQRLVGSGAWVKSFLTIAKKNHWILLSATPGDSWLDYIPVFVANGFYKNKTEFKREHVVYASYSKFPKVERYLGVGRLVKLRNQILVHMPYEKQTRRIVRTVEVSFDKELLRKVTLGRWNVFEGRPLRDAAEMYLVARKLVNSDPSRLDAIRELMTYHDRLIVYYTFDYELEILRTLGDEPWVMTSEKRALSLSEIPSPQTQTSTDRNSKSLSPLDESPTYDTRTMDSKSNTNSSRSSARELETNSQIPNSSVSNPAFSLAEWNGHKHEPIPDTKSWIYLVQYTAGSEAWNCVTTNAMCFYSLTYSYKAFEQSHGRIERLNTPYRDLYYYVLQSKSWIDMAIRSALDSKQNFQEAKYTAQLKI